MSRKPVVSGFKGAAFRGIDFSKYVTSWEDTRSTTGPIHKYNKRDGGEAEYMGRKPHSVNVHLAYIGTTWRDDFLALQAVIDEDPIGTLTHPVYGSMNAFCRGTGARLDVQDAPNFYEVNVTFEESEVDTKAEGSNDQGPSTKQQAVSTAGTNFSTAAVLFTTAATSVAALISAANTYAAAAVESAVSLVANPSLPGQLANVTDYTNTAIAAILADPVAATVNTATAIAYAEELLDACTQLDDAVKALRPKLFVYTVPTMMHITALATMFYGEDGAAREAEILSNNPGLLDPGFVEAGTELLMAPATV